MTIENEKDRAYRILVDNALSGPGCIMRPDSYQRLLILGMEQHRVATTALHTEFEQAKADFTQAVNANQESTSSLRDAVEFHPALIINGENLVAGTGLNEQQPRTAIGQAKDGTVIMMVIDGRQMHSFGISIERCGEIMEQYGAYQASMLDGGSSSVMVYRGREITSPTTLSQNEEGRYLPDAFLVK